MKIELYFPHDACMQNQYGVADLIESENVSGYGAYWAILEYLRLQENYTGDVRAIRGIARRVGARLDKMTRVLNDYGLFVIEGNSFYSPYLNEAMRPLEEKRARKRMQQKAETEHPNEQSVHQGSHNELEISENIPKEKKSKEKKNKISTSSDVVDADWESYIDALGREPQWVEMMAKRSGLGTFVKRFDEVLKLFKQHVVALGNEQNIRSLKDAKRYFNNYNTPGSIPFTHMVEELQKPVDKGVYKYEDCIPTKGKRSYCGVPIPPEAPPRPNSQAVWCEGKWVY